MMRGLVVALVAVALQDPADLVRKLGSSDAAESGAAREALLKFGPRALPALRAAPTSIRPAAAPIIERLELRQAAAGGRRSFQGDLEDAGIFRKFDRRRLEVEPKRFLEFRRASFSVSPQPVQPGSSGQ